MTAFVKQSLSKQVIIKPLQHPTPPHHFLMILLWFGFHSGFRTIFTSFPLKYLGYSGSSHGEFQVGNLILQCLFVFSLRPSPGFGLYIRLCGNNDARHMAEPSAVQMYSVNSVYIWFEIVSHGLENAEVYVMDIMTTHEVLWRYTCILKYT